MKVKSKSCSIFDNAGRNSGFFRPKAKKEQKTKGGSCRKDYYIKSLQDKCRYLHSSI